MARQQVAQWECHDGHGPRAERGPEQTHKNAPEGDMEHNEQRGQFAQHVEGDPDPDDDKSPPRSSVCLLDQFSFLCQMRKAETIGTSSPWL